MRTAWTDPASLSLSIDFGHLRRFMAEKDIWPTLGSAFTGGQEISELLSNKRFSGKSAQRINIAATVWHEKRHFVDLLLTNYGSYIYRTPLLLALNAHSILENSKDDTLLIPLELNANPAHRALYGLAPLQIEAEPRRLLHEIMFRKSMLALDRKAVAEVPGAHYIGPTALLEALATLTERHGLQHFFGRKGLHLRDSGNDFRDFGDGLHFGGSATFRKPRW